MRYCSHHWDMMRDEMIRLGMGHQVEGFGDQDALIAKAETYEKISDIHDPLMLMALFICSRVHEAGGPYVLWGDRCPLCESDNHDQKPSPEVVKTVAFSIRKVAEVSGWATPAPAVM